MTTRQSAHVVAVVTSDFEQGAYFDLQFTKNVITEAPMTTPEVSRQLSLEYSSQPPDVLSNFLEERVDRDPQIRVENKDVLLGLQKQAQNFELMNRTREECLAMYMDLRPINYRHILAVSSNATSNNSILWLETPSSRNESSTKQVCNSESYLDDKCYSWNGTDFKVIFFFWKISPNIKTFRGNGTATKFPDAW